MENDFALNNTRNTLCLNERGTDPEGRFEQNERVEALTCHHIDSSIARAIRVHDIATRILFHTHKPKTRFCG